MGIGFLDIFTKGLVSFEKPMYRKVDYFSYINFSQLNDSIDQQKSNGFHLILMHFYLFVGETHGIDA